MNISNLKGQKKLEAIEQMGNDIQYLDTLLELAQSEKGTAKTLAMEALAKFDTPKTNFLWEKMLKSKSKGELVLG